jgi:pimeloyl-ACP methyl ester carboxylesterase
MPQRTLYATLIGINTYPKQPLAGCIRDVLAIDQLLREQCAQQKEPLTYKPLYLLAPNDADTERIDRYNEGRSEPIKFEAPSFENVSRKAFAHLKAAKDGDICVFFYSGHGSHTDAPEVFWHTKPDRQNETIVCVDSRDPNVPEARDLIDKEIAYLLWDALDGKDVHTLVIMDCCHSGSNTREMADGTDTVRYRFQPSSKTKIPFENYIGHGDFYKVEDGNASIQIARYVQLAAARDTEKAREVGEGGLFTSQLIKLLRTGGTAKTYRDLVQSVAVNVRNQNQGQNPVAFAREKADMNLQFLGGDLLPYTPTYEVRYSAVDDQWLMSGGLMYGITPPAGEARTTIKILSGEGTNKKEIDVTEVLGDVSVLNKTHMEGFDKGRSDYKAEIVRLANSAVKIGLSKTLLADAAMTAKIREAFASASLPFIELVSDQDSEVAYLIQPTSDNKYILTHSNSSLPLFKREADSSVFIRQVDQVGKWLNTIELKNLHTSFQKGDFVFAFERIEGQAINKFNRETVTGEKWNLSPDEEVVLSYVDNQQPAFRLSVSIAPDSTLKECFVGALYLDSMYGIESGMIQADSGRLVKNGNPLELGYVANNRFTKTIKLQIDPNYSLYNINEITDYLKVFLSSHPLDLSRYRQDSLELDPEPTRAIDKGLVTNDSLENELDWTVFDFKLRIVGPNKEKTLVPGSTTDFSQFAIETPEGFTAQAYAATNDDILRLQRITTAKGVDDDAQPINLIPPATLWGDTITEVAFRGNLDTGSDNRIQVLELRSLDGKPLVLPEGKSLLIQPKGMEASTRSIDEEAEEVIIPCGFDEDSKLWYPIGSSDADGTVHIDFLPPETQGVVQGAKPGAKSAGSSVKMFFRKLFRKKKGVDVLVLHEVKKDGTWEELTDNPNRIEKELKNKPIANVLLLTHGLTGDTGHMVEAMKELDELPRVADYVLTYDYENLSTPIDDAGKTLHKNLTEIGFGKPEFPKITFIAHSQGCLVSRWMVEKEGGHVYVKHLILVAGASSGSELAKLGTTVFSMITHALNVTGPIKFALKGLTFLLKALKADPGRALKDTNPGSPFITKLGASRQADGVRYSVIIGDLALIEREFDEEDTFLQNLKRVLAKKVVVPWFTQGLFDGQSNDIAVTIPSATFIRGFDDKVNTRIVASNHLAYFCKKLAEKELLELLQSGDAI